MKGYFKKFLMSIIDQCRLLNLSEISIASKTIGSCFFNQEVKHWIDPKIIPYGWGSFDQKQFEGNSPTKDVSCVILPLLSSEPGTNSNIAANPSAQDN